MFSEEKLVPESPLMKRANPVRRFVASRSGYLFKFVATCSIREEMALVSADESAKGLSLVLRTASAGSCGAP